LKAGEILYIPHEWFHHVKSLDNNLAVSYWYSNSSIKDSKNVPKLARKVINSLE
jgi:dTDP-4-dehydrorhamnose 3,5-epimerase-like enzyme